MLLTFEDPPANIKVSENFVVKIQRDLCILSHNLFCY
jgi:hypothetical protein